ncbi:MAG: flagellar basal body L-ring protein FlgH [Pirellulaceae bacterium]|nr:flagellar basal body L-ring protein FlgH [Pirellulaceae bacterium]
MRFFTWIIATLLLVTNGTTLWAQTASLFQRELQLRKEQKQNKQDDLQYTLESASWTYVPPQQPLIIAENDIVTIRVNEQAQVVADGQLQRQRTSAYDAVLSEWIKLVGLKAIKPAPQADGDIKVSGSVNQTFRADGDLETRESMTFEIAATVVSVRPNGTLVVEAHRTIRNNDEVWKYSLHGNCRREDILANNVILSKNIAGLTIEKSERGAVRDSYRRGWFLEWMDRYTIY